MLWQLVTSSLLVGASIFAGSLLPERLGWLLAGIAVLLAAFNVLLSHRTHLLGKQRVMGHLESARCVGQLEPEDRVTLYLPTGRGRIGEKKDLRQAVPYLPTGAHRRRIPLRRIRAEVGIAGRSYRLGKRQVYLFDEDVGVAERLITLQKDFGFSERGAKRHEPDRMSYLALPVIKDVRGVDKVTAVVYMDSPRSDTFIDNSRIARIEQACIPIAAQVNK